jgi:hypothetical protein
VRPNVQCIPFRLLSKINPTSLGSGESLVGMPGYLLSISIPPKNKVESIGIELIR